MDFEVTNVFWGFVAVIVLRKAWNKMVIHQNEKQEVMGKPREMRDIDPTALGMPIYRPVGPYAIQ